MNDTDNSTGSTIDVPSCSNLAAVSFEYRELVLMFISGVCKLCMSRMMLFQKLSNLVTLLLESCVYFKA